MEEPIGVEADMAETLGTRTMATLPSLSCEPVQTLNMHSIDLWTGEQVVMVSTSPCLPGDCLVVSLELAKFQENRTNCEQKSFTKPDK